MRRARRLPATAVDDRSSGDLVAASARLVTGRRLLLGARVALRRRRLGRARSARGALAGRRTARRGARRAGGPGRTAVGLVEAGALEDDTDRREDLAQRAAADRTLGQRVVGELLHSLQSLAAACAGVLVGGHPSLRVAGTPTR